MYFEKIILPEEILNLHANSSEIFVKNQKKKNACHLVSCIYWYISNVSVKSPGWPVLLECIFDCKFLKYNEKFGSNIRYVYFNGGIFVEPDEAL